MDIVAIAAKYVGKTEKINNSGFVDPEFEAKMKDVGFVSGQSWCAYFAELVWKEAYGKNHPLYSAMDQLFSASAVATWAHFKN